MRCSHHADYLWNLKVRRLWQGRLWWWLPFCQLHRVSVCCRWTCMYIGTHRCVNVYLDLDVFIYIYICIYSCTHGLGLKLQNDLWNFKTIPFPSGRPLELQHFAHKELTFHFTLLFGDSKCHRHAILWSRQHPQYLVLPLFCLFIRSGWDSFCTPLLVLVLGLLSAQKTLALNWTRVQSVLDVKVRIHCRPPRFTATRFRYLKAKKRRKSDEDHGWKRLEGAGSSKPGWLRMVFFKDNLTCRTLQTTNK